MNDMDPIPPSAHRGYSFYLGDAISGEPQLYCYQPPRWTLGTRLMLAALWQGLTAVRRRLWRSSLQSEPDASSMLPAAVAEPQRAKPIRRAA